MNYKRLLEEKDSTTYYMDVFKRKSEYDIMKEKTKAVIILTNEKIKWHPAFAAAMQLELKEYKEHLEFLTEYQLTDEPLRIDILVIKKLDDIKINKSIGLIFRKYNIFEYKSPTDYISIDDYYKVKAYAYLYKALSEGTNKINIKEMTITLTSSKYPRKLIDYLKREQGAIIEKIDNGIYDIKNTDIETQLIVAKELKDEEAKYLKLLQAEHNNKELIKKWIAEYIGNIKDPLYRIIMNVLTEANPNEILEVYKDMGIGKINNDNREFILEVIKKLELDKKLKEEGIDIGEDRKALKVAEKMIKRGDSVEDIVEITELPKEKVLELKNRLGF
ncbi:3-isopropylmalate dehydrogenase [Clostridium sp. DJ247]|uniref:3-isopropylmalate dehydrogenase n=1 Tax=Clostridium sp. DJ247 TaxID=2726188 RepID=UPI001626D745|nr:3-isopropylmalate dehydrogenase [Clostridium sp. DJ247]MBC2582280.1 3-isopropylmalate dehydrogenase [Clostridium sp. DJ247]